MVTVSLSLPPPHLPPPFAQTGRVKWLTKITITEKESDNYYHYFDNRILPPQVDKEIADKDGWWYKPDYLFNELNINRSLFFLSVSLCLSLCLWECAREPGSDKEGGRQGEREVGLGGRGGWGGEGWGEGDAPSRTNPRYL